MTTTPDPPVEARLAALLQRVATGDHLAYADLYDATSSRVFGVVLRVLRDRAQAEEVSQEVYLQVWQQADRFDAARGTASTWILTRAHRKAVDRVRSSSASRRRDVAHAEHQDRARSYAHDETAAAAHASLEAREVQAALTTLTPAQRQAIELAYFGGYTYLEVSQLVQAPLGTTKTRIRDGLIRLRAAMTATGPEVVQLA